MTASRRPRTLAAAALALAVAAVPVSSRGGGDAVPAFAAPAPAEVVVLRGGELLRVDPVTLRARSRGVVVGAGSAFARGGDTLAAAAPNDPRVRFVDLGRMRPAGRAVELGPGATVDTMQWLDADTLAAVTWGSPRQLVLVDAAARRVARRVDLDGAVLARATARGALVLLLGPAEAIGPTTLVVVDRGGRVRSASLREIAGGSAPAGGVDHRQVLPGLAVDPAGRRAVVVPPGGGVAEVALGSLAVRYHDLARATSLLGRLRDWLEPSAHAKSVGGPERHAFWAGRDTVAVVTLEQAGIRAKGGEYRQLAHARGVELIDTRRWSVRTLSERAGGVAVADGTLLVYGGAFAAGAPFSAERGPQVTGLDGVSPDGDERFRLLPTVRVGHVAAAARYAYVLGARATFVVDVARGVVVGRAAGTDVAVVAP